MTEKILDRAERLRDMASTILPVLLRLSEVVSVDRINIRKATNDLLVLIPFPFTVTAQYMCHLAFNHCVREVSNKSRSL